MRHLSVPAWPVIDRAHLTAVVGGLTSTIRARPAAKDPVPLALPGAKPAPAVAMPVMAPPAPAPAAPDPMVAMMNQLAQGR